MGHSLYIYTLLNISAGGRDSTRAGSPKGRQWALGEDTEGAGTRRTMQGQGAPQALSCQNQRDVQTAYKGHLKVIT